MKVMALTYGFLHVVGFLYHYCPLKMDEVKN